MTPVEQLAEAVTKVKGAKNSAVQLIKDAAAYITAHANEPALLRAYAADLTADADELGAAVVSNPLPTDPVP